MKAVRIARKKIDRAFRRVRTRVRRRRGHCSYWWGRGQLALAFDSHVQFAPIDKSTWGPGPWQHEPDWVYWERPWNDPAGLRCLVARTEATGTLCGYVRLPARHPWSRLPWDRIDAEVHGGITFAETIGAHRWIGFHCGHSRDRMPAIEARLEALGYKRNEPPEHYAVFMPETYRELSFVRAETERLAEQVSAAK